MMTSAVFRSTMTAPAQSGAPGPDAAASARVAPAAGAPDAPVSVAAGTRSAAPGQAAPGVPHAARRTRTRTATDWKDLAGRIVAPMLGIALMVGVWALVSASTGSAIPSPSVTFAQAVALFSDPFYRNGPNDQGIGWNVLMSLQRVGMGFGMAALVGIPLGFLIGRFAVLSRMFNPLISLLRPVSPLAWLPIGLLVFKGANPAAIWTIFICSIWPMVINTAVGVQRVPQDYMNVARVLNLSEWKIVTKILFPAVLPYMLTGVRLAVGTAWLVIVAAEMLTGGVGIGFWVWDEWNNLNVTNILIAIFVIGTVGLLLEVALIRLATAFTYEEVKS